MYFMVRVKVFIDNYDNLKMNDKYFIPNMCTFCGNINASTLLMYCYLELNFSAN